MTRIIIFYVSLTLIMLFIAKFLRSAHFKGKMGESGVKIFLPKFLRSDEYHFINDVILRTPDGTTQIDHVIVSPYGIFVIETKNMNGWIFGTEKDKFWTQKIYNNSQRFQNPLHQNYKHTETLRVLLGLEKRFIHSLVVFTGDGEFKTQRPENVFTSIRSCAKYILSKTEKVFDTQKMEEIIEKIKNSCLEPSLKIRRQHIQSLRNKKGGKCQ